MDENREEAARWFAIVHRGLMTQDERAAFQTWLHDAVNAAAFDRLEVIWQDLGGVGAVEPQADSIPADSVISSRPARFAAMLSAASLLFGVLYRFDGSWWTTLDWWSR